jgi:adenosine kinase
MNILVTGSLAFDQIMVFPDAFADHIMPDKLHVLSVSFTLDRLHKNFGGVAGNISYNLGLLGENPICMATVGKDGEDYQSFLGKNGVVTDFIKVNSKDYTASFVMFTDKKDCQIAGFYPGAMKHDTELSLDEAMKEANLITESCFGVIAPTQPEAMVARAYEFSKLGIKYAYNPAQQTDYLTSGDLIKGIEGAEIVIGNDFEIALLEKKSRLSKQDMLEKVKVIITTLGDRGSLIEQKDKKEIIVGVAKPREVVDPTGSGDAYLAGFLSAYLKGKSMVECGQWGATVATYAVESYGSTGHSFSMSLFENRLKENFG